MDNPGKLILVPTPIGNLDDITLRAIDTLKKADILLAEDTRVSSKLMRHLMIDRKLTPHHKFNEHKKLESILAKLQEGKTVALISDAGTPGISDPGYLLVRTCAERNIPVECLPGATALIPALAVSGLPTDRFVFEGFLPHKKGRQKRLQQLSDETRTLIFYESPFRLVKTLAQLCETFGETRRACVCRELSKMFEEVQRGGLVQLKDYFTQNAPRGEIVIVVDGKPKKRSVQEGGTDPDG